MKGKIVRKSIGLPQSIWDMVDKFARREAPQGYKPNRSRAVGTLIKRGLKVSGDDMGESDV